MGEAAATRADDYLNVVTALGTSQDKSSSSAFAAGADLTPQQLEELYEQEALAARIVDRPVDDATRVPFDLAGPDEAVDWPSIQSELDDRDALSVLGDGWRWARLYGGALVVMTINDGLSMAEPLDLQRATKLLDLDVIEAPYVTPKSYQSRLGRRAFRAPERYQIAASAGDGKLATNTVHRSRCIRFDGVRVPPGRLLTRTRGWGPSVLQRVCTQLRRLGTTEGYAENILHELSVMVLSIDGFREQLLSADSQDDVKKVFAAMRHAIDNLHTLPLDAKDTYMERSRSVAGLETLMLRFVDAVVRVTDMPRTILLGEQPGGLNANADGEIRGWFDHVSTQQERVLTPAIGRLLEVIFALRGRRGEVVPSEWTIKWGSLWQPSEKEKATTRVANANADGVYLNLGVMSAEEVRERLIGEGDLKPLNGKTPSQVRDAERYLEPEAPEEAPFGPRLWPEYRGLPGTSNDEAMALYEAIKTHFASTKRVGLPPPMVAVLRTLLKSGWYASVIHEPPQKTLYRGLRLSKKAAMSLVSDLGAPWDEAGGSTKLTGVAAPNDNGHSSSWTPSKATALEFATKYGEAKRGYAVILVAKVADNPERFVAGPGGLYNVAGLSRWHLEKESIGLEPIVADRIEWSPLDEDV